MATYQIDKVGTADVERRELICNFSISSAKFFDLFGDLLTDDVPRDVVRQAIDNPGEEISFGRRDRSELNDFFEKVANVSKDRISDTQMGFGAGERSEAARAESMKSREGQKEILYQDRDTSTSAIETYDSTTGEQEGKIVLGDRGAEGDLVPLTITEKVETHYEFNADEDIAEDRKTSGQFIIKNPSSRNKIWDIDINFEKDKPASLDDTIHINNLDPEAEEVIDYELEEFEEPALKVHEFISTLNDTEVETYSLSLTEENVVLFKLTAKNIRDYPIKNITITKEIIEGYMNVDILETTLGEAETDMDNSIVWKIEELDPESEATLSFNMTIDIPNTEYKPKTGKVSAEFYADKALTGIKIDEFDAYSDNFVGIEVTQQDDNPDMYTCSVQFWNESDFQMQLVNLDIVNAETDEKVLDIDPEEIPTIAAEAKWISKQWETETEDGAEPHFYKTIEFFLVGDREISTMGAISIDDIELAVAMMEGKLDYSTTSIESYRIIPFDVLMQVKNTGGADLNELILKDTIQEGYIPPNAEDIELYIVRPEEDEDVSEGFDEDEEIDWEDLGEQIIIDPRMVEITPDNQEPDQEHVVEIKLEELRDNPIGMILPGTIIRAKYPITAHKPARGTEFVSNVMYSANTYPAGAPIEIIPEPITIPVVHKRKKILKGKKVQALPTEGKYQIVLSLRNTGENVLENLEIRDVVPENFEYGDYNEEPSRIESLEGKDMLIWVIESVEPNDKIEITYEITGIGDEYKASEAQLSV